MQLIIDHISSVIVSAVVILAGLNLLGVANRASVRVALNLAATGNHLWLTEVLDQDLVNLGATPFDPKQAIKSYANTGSGGHLEFVAPIEPDGAVNHIRWEWTTNGSVLADSGLVQKVFPRYDVVRYVGVDSTSYSASSRGWAARFDLRLLDGQGQPPAADSLAQQIHVQVLTLAQNWGNNPPYRILADYEANYNPVNLHR